MGFVDFGPGLDYGEDLFFWEVGEGEVVVWGEG